MNINKNNYEAFFLDYHEGNLTPQQAAELLLFVEQNPHLQEEFESFENIQIEDFSAFQYDDKEDLKKIITKKNREEYFIRSVEGSLTAAEKTLLTAFLEMHPQYLYELLLLHNTKMQADESITFENKEALQYAGIRLDLMIASMEGLLSNEQDALLRERISQDTALQRDFFLLQQTKLTADTSILFNNKKTLKRDDRKAVPFFYYAAIAASVLFLAGLYFIFNTNRSQINLADQAVEIKHQKSHPFHQQAAQGTTKNQVQSFKNEHAASFSADAKKRSGSKNKTERPVVQLADIKDQAPSVDTAENLAGNKIISNPVQPLLPLPKKEAAYDAAALVKADVKDVHKNEFLSLGELAAVRIKEKMLDADVLQAQKRSGKLKKINGWDVLQIIAKGASRLSGRKVEIKPTYNDEGEVTAYALGAGGFEFSKRK